MPDRPQSPLPLAANAWSAAVWSVKRRAQAVLFAAIAALLLALVVVIGLQVFYRYVLNDSLAWTEEMARLILVWMTFLGAGLASFRGVHLKLDLFAENLAPAVKKAQAALTAVAVLFFLGVLFAGNIDVIEVRESLPFTSFPLSSKYLSYAISTGAVLMGAGTIVSFLMTWLDGYARSSD